MVGRGKDGVSMGWLDGGSGVEGGGGGAEILGICLI